MSLPAYQDHELALPELHYILAIIPETFVYGVYSCLVPVFIFVMLTKGLRTRVRKVLFLMSLFMYFISTINWSLSVANTILLFKNDFLSPASQAVALYLPLFSAISLVNVNYSFHNSRCGLQTDCQRSVLPHGRSGRVARLGAL